MSVNSGVQKIEGLAQPPLDVFNVEELQNELQRFFSDYGWRQSAIADLNDVVKADLSTWEAMVRWLSIDSECRSELQKLKIWPEATKVLKGIDEASMASGMQRLWATPIKVNYPAQ